MRKVLSLCLSLLAATAVCGQEKIVKVVEVGSSFESTFEREFNRSVGSDRYVMDSLVVISEYSSLDFGGNLVWLGIIRDCIENGRLTGIDLSHCYYLDEISDMAFLPSGVNGMPRKAVAESNDDVEKNPFRMNLRHITLPNRLKKIGSGAFACTNLESIDIPHWTETIGSGAFDGCEYLKDVVLRGNQFREESDGYAFTNIGNDAVLHVAPGLGAAYSSAAGWGQFACVHEGKEAYKVLSTTTGNGVALSDVLAADDMCTDSVAISGTLGDADMVLLRDRIDYGRIVSLDLSDCTVDDGKLFSCRLKYLRMPRRMDKINNGFLADADVCSLTLPDSYDEIGCTTFSCYGGFADSTFVVAEGCRKICWRALYNCRSIKRLVLPSTLEVLETNSLGMNHVSGGHIPAMQNVDVYVNRMCPPTSWAGCKEFDFVYPTSQEYGPFGCYGIENKSECCVATWRLFVPVGAKQNYENDEHWSHIPTIIETPLLTGTTDGIREAVTTGAGLKMGTSSADGIYTLDGRLVTSDTSARTMARGLYVVRSGGTARKVVMGR